MQEVEVVLAEVFSKRQHLVQMSNACFLGAFASTFGANLRRTLWKLCVTNLQLQSVFTFVVATVALHELPFSVRSLRE